MTAPSTAIIRTSNQIGTTQPPQVTPGSSRCSTPGGASRRVNTTCRIGSTAYVSGLTLVSTASQTGRPTSGNSDPDRNIIGVSTSCTSGMTAWNFLIRAEIISPNAVIASAVRNSSASSPTIITGSYGTPTR